MYEFDFDLEDGEIAQVIYEPVDYDDYGDIEFEVSVFKDSEDITDDITANDEAKIQKQVKKDYAEICRDNAAEAAISQWESSRDFP
jgi:hypothetical protein